MHLESLLASFVVMPSHSGTENLQIILRWIHFLAGITWIGLLYFFNLVNVPWMKQVDAGMKPKVFEHLTLPALWWFRWSAVVTVFVGFWYWVQTIVLVDFSNATGVDVEHTNGARTVTSFFLIWMAAWVIEYVIVLQSSKIAALNNGWIFAVLVTILVAIAGWLFADYNSHGWESSRLIAIGIGGGMGLFMMLNVWGIIWRNNKAVISGTLAGTPPANGAALGRQAFLASRTNAWMSIPMLFFMAAASHYVMFGR